MKACNYYGFCRASRQHLIRSEIPFLSAFTFVDSVKGRFPRPFCPFLPAGADKSEAERVAAQVNAQLVQGAPSLLSFTPVSVPELRRQFLGHHELARGSTLATVNRYRAATQHLENFTLQSPKPPQAHEVKPDWFASYLRTLEVATNGHANTAKRRLRSKGVQFILETTRSLYHFAGKRRYPQSMSINSRRGPAWFRAMDRNGDGDVSRREFTGTGELFDKLDLDKNGLLDPEEAAKAEPKK